MEKINLKLKQKKMNIRQFNQNEIITRVKPAESINGYNGDRSYLGEPLLLCGIKNGSIYLKRMDELEVKIFGEEPVQLPLDVWSNGWEKWEDPTELCNKTSADFAVKNKIESIASKIDVKQIKNSDLIGFTFKVDRPTIPTKFGMLLFTGFFTAIGLHHGIMVPNTVLGNISNYNFTTQLCAAQYIKDNWVNVEFYKFNSHLDLMTFADYIIK